jgi:YhcH/YjgK/YiaL family protein
MVLDVLQNKERYYPLHRNFKEAFAYLEKCLENKPEPGKHEIKGDELFALVQQYETRPGKDNRWEGHRDYIDIQAVLSGNEIMEWANIADAGKDVTYNEQNDHFYFGDVRDATECKLKKTWFSILWPEDLHKPKCVWDKAESVDKVIIKVRL